MGNLFSKKSKKPQQTKITEQDRAVLQLKQQRDRLKQYKRRVETQLEKEREIAIELIKNGRKDRALLLLRKKRMLEAQLDKSEGILNNVEQLINELEFAQVEVDVVNRLRQGTDALKKMNEMLKLEDVEKLMEDTREAVEYQEEVTNALSGNLSHTDEREVLAELEEMIREETGNETIHLPDVPTHSLIREDQRERPIKQKTPTTRERVLVAE